MGLDKKTAIWLYEETKKLTMLFSVVLLVIVPAYAASPEQPNSVSTDQNSLQILIDKANNGDPNDQYNLGKVFADGNVVPQDFNEAFMWFEKAAEQGNAKAQYNLGRMYRKGKGVPQDYNEAIKWYTKSAKQGKAYAQYSLALMYYYGDDIPQDYNKAFKWFSKAAEQGDADAMFKLGEIYSYGEGVTEDTNIAMEWYLKAAQAGDAEAMYELGDIYRLGRGIAEDPNKAKEWYSKAIELYRKDADAGDSDAMYKIGLMYETGRGVDEDYEEARDWYKKAIEIGDNEANIQLLVIYIKKYYKIALLGFLSVLIAGGFIYATEKRSYKDAQVFEIDSKAEKWSLWVTIRRYVGALIIYLIYWITLWGPIRQVVGATLSPDKAKEQVEIGAIESIWEYGWGDHYIWFLIIFCLVAYCCGVLAGATAKKKGVLIASIANLPIVIFTILFYCFFYKVAIDLDVESPIAWKIIFPLSILGSIIFSTVGGLRGVHWQNDEFGSSTILGIRPLHWSWLWLVSAFYIRGIAYAMIPIITWRWDDSYGPSILQILYLFIYGYPMYLMYQILNGDILSNKNRLIKIISFIGIYLGGIVAAILFDLIRLGLSKLISSIF